jgi:sigma-E factor negative regulatory protein RseB
MSPSRGSGRVSVFLVGALLQVAAVRAGHAQDDAKSWLERMAHAAQTLSYDGIFVYVQGARVDVMRVVHSVDKGVERERLVTLTGPVREVVRRGDTVTCILPNEEAVAVGTKPARSRFPKVFTARFSLIAQSYEFRLGGKDRVAGRETQHIVLRPKDSFRYGYDLWLDDASGLLLRSQTIDPEGQQVEQILFTTIQFLPSVPEALLEPQTQGRHLTWQMPDAGTTAPQDARWRVTWLPSGFFQTAHELRQVVPEGPPTDHSVFSDGLASVSLFVERAQGGSSSSAEPPHGVQAMGAMHAYRRRLGDLLVTVVGEVPAVTVRRIGDSIHAAGQP